MTAPKSPTCLPAWPRLLTRELAAAYVGHSVGMFLADVGTVWPDPVTGTRRKVWDRLMLDQAIERLPGAVIADRDAYLEATREARRSAWETKRRAK
jgi:hypothetical protein